jgi:DNA-binding NarL/FixJ family response regulator
VRILLVDDHAIVRDGLRRILADEFEGATIGEAANADEAMAQVRAGAWDVVVLDLSLPGRGGLEVLREIRAQHRDLPVLVMTMYSEDQYALRAFRNGASGYVTKGCGADELVRAVRKVQGGGRYVTPSLAEVLAASLTGNPGAAPHEALSDRELQVLRMLASGKAVKEIGFDLGLNEKTVSTYRTRMLEKLGLRTTAEIIRYAIRAGLVE